MSRFSEFNDASLKLNAQAAVEWLLGTYLVTTDPLTESVIEVAVNALWQSFGRKTCAWCGHSELAGSQAMVDHMMECVKHPVGQALRALERTEAGLVVERARRARAEALLRRMREWQALEAPTAEALMWRTEIGELLAEADKQAAS
jgi:hypothetical protein